MNDSEDLVTLIEPNGFQSCVRHENHIYKIRPFGLNELSDLNLQQALVIKDLLFVLLGNQGNYIRFSEKYDPTNVHMLIKGPDFKIAKHLDISLKLITKKIIKFGKYYCALSYFLQMYDHEKFGKVIQSLCYNLVCFKSQYEKSVIEIETQFKFNPSFSLNMVENLLTKEVSNSLNHYYEIINLIHEDTLHRQTINQNSGNNYFNNFINYLQQDLRQTGTIDLSTDIINFDICKGGVVLKIVQDRIKSYKGDFNSSKFLLNLFQSISEDYLKALNQWLIHGVIDDPFEEFLIKENKFPTNILNSNMEKYWDEVFMIRNDGIISQFSDKTIQLKILLTGKYLNIFKTCVGLENFEGLQELISPINNLLHQDFELKINNFYKRANKLLMKLLFSGYNFTIMTEFFLETFLIQNSFKIDKFLDRNFNDLQRNKFKVSISKLIKSFNQINSPLAEAEEELKNSKLEIQLPLYNNLEFSIDSSNFFELAREILNVKSFDAEAALKDNSNAFKELLNKSLQNNSSDRMQPPAQSQESDNYDILDNIDDLTIMGINLDINLPFPLNLIVNQSYNFEYQLIFKHQLICKFLSKLIDNTWKEINLTTVWKFPKFDSRVKKWILRSRILHNRMKDFVNVFQYYINFEIVDSNIKDIMQYLDRINAHLDQEPFATNLPDQSNDADSSGILNHNNSNNSGFPANANSSMTKGVSPINYNELFNNEDKFSQRRLPNSNTSDEELIDLNTLINKIGTILNNILRDSFLTNEKIIAVVKKLFNIIILYNNFLTRLKKSLIMMNEELFSEFQQVYPSRFNSKDLTEDLMNNRFNNLSQMLNYHFEAFNNNLNDFMILIKNYGDIENRQFLMLMERLEQCFPDY